MATIRDVARASGVSVATVSRVFNESALVSDATRDRVVDTATRLGYWPNGTARSLITSRTHALGVLLPDLHGEFFSELIRGIDSAARKRRLHLLVSSYGAGSDDLLAALRTVQGRVDGLIVMAPDVGASMALRLRGGNPTVLLNPEIDVAGRDRISIANFDGAHAMVSHLIGLGHRRIATITGPDRNIDGRQRLEGYRVALRDEGIEPSGALEIQGDFTERAGYDGALELLRRKPRPSAIFAANDHMAVGVLGALQDCRVGVPDDVAVAGFDDIPMARYLTPPLTTVHVDMMRLGQRAVEMLLEPAGRDGGEGRREILTTTLVVRRSCGSKPPPAHPKGERVRWERRHAVASRSRKGLGA